MTKAKKATADTPPPPQPTHGTDENGNELHVQVLAPNGFDRTFEIAVIRKNDRTMVERFTKLSANPGARYVVSVTKRSKFFQIEEPTGAFKVIGRSTEHGLIAAEPPPIPLRVKGNEAWKAELQGADKTADPDAPAKKRATASAKRSKKNADENPHQFYETPQWAVDVIAPYLTLPKHNAVIADLGAGHGALTRHLANHTDAATMRTINLEVQGAFREKFADRDPERHAFHQIDIVKEAARARELIADAHLIIANPAFKLGELIARVALGDGMRPTQEVAFLLPIDFLCAKERRGFHQRFASDFYPFSERIKFSGMPHSGMANYAWFVWGKHTSGRFFVL